MGNPGRPHAVYAEIEGEFIEMWKTPSMTIGDIAFRIGVDESTVKRSVKRLGLPPRGKGFCPPERRAS